MASSNKAQDAYIDTVADEDATGDLHELYDRVRNGIVILMTYSFDIWFCYDMYYNCLLALVLPDVLFALLTHVVRRRHSRQHHDHPQSEPWRT